MKLLDVLMLTLFLGICLGVGAIGGLITGSSVKTWFPTIRKPSWNPPSWLFGPVWTALYTFMALAGWLIWRDGKFIGLPGVLFCIQLTLNFGWSWLFFGLKRPDLALLEIIALWALILATMLTFLSLTTAAGLLFLLYLLWVSFATVLNFAIWRLNSPRTSGSQP
jgi:benzodiazapine receptor